MYPGIGVYFCFKLTPMKSESSVAMMRGLGQNTMRQVWRGSALLRRRARASPRLSQGAKRFLGVPTTSHLFSDPAVIPEVRRAAMALSARLQVELEPEVVDKICVLLEKKSDTETLYAHDYRQLLFNTLLRVGFDTTACSEFIRFMNPKSPIVRNIVNESAARKGKRDDIKAAFERAEEKSLPELPRIPDSADTRAFTNFVMVGINRIIAMNSGDFREIKFKKLDDGGLEREQVMEDDVTLKAIQWALEYASALIQGDPTVLPSSWLDCNDEEGAEVVREIAYICMICFLHIRQITPDDIFRLFMDSLIKDQWHDNEALGKLKASEVAELFHATAALMRSRKSRIASRPKHKCQRTTTQ